MNTLLICGLQVTLVALVGCLTSIAMRRWLRTSAALPIGATLGAVVLLTACAFSPWPSWLHRPEESAATTNSQPVETNAATVTPVKKPNLVAFGWRKTAMAAWEGLMEGERVTPSTHVMRAENQPATPHWTWLQVFGVIFAVGVVVGLVRLIGGLWAVRLFVRNSRPLKAPELLEQIDLLRAELACTPPVDIRECPHLATAATVGWRRPVILLSDTWRTWSGAQLKSVLAHEIAHITRGDFLAGVAAQLGVVLHFYHPLVHWLVNRLRLEQELAADALAAQVVGGSRAYLIAIGELALRQTREPLGWPAQTFLPTRRTFLRRIEMLRDLKLLSGQAPLALRWGTLAAIAAVTLVAIGLRPPGGKTVGPSTVAAADKPAASTATKPAKSGQVLNPIYVPADASLVIVIRPADVLKVYREILEKTTALSRDGFIDQELLEMYAGCEQFCAIGTPSAQMQPAPFDAGVCVTFVNKAARDAFPQAMSPQGVDWKKKQFANFEYEEISQGLIRYMPDDRTLIFGNESTLLRMMVTGPKSLSPLTQTDAWKQAAGGTVAIAIDQSGMQAMAVGFPKIPFFGMFSPLWESASNHTIGLKLDEKLALTLTSQAKDDAGAEKIKATLLIGITMLTNIAGNLKNNPEPGMEELEKKLSGLQPTWLIPARLREPGMEELEKKLSEMLNSHKLAANGKQVTLSLSGNVAELMPLVVGPVVQALPAAQLPQQQNNLKQVMLAMHNYHDAFGRFPPAVVIDKASGVPHSWRVEILPYLKQQLLYNQYKMNEPWDSEANRKVLALMPVTYRHPSQDASTNTAIIAAYGKGLMFEEGDTYGTKITDVVDGTSSTIAVVEAKTEIPWTKPEDIVIDVTKDKLPEFGFDGTGFNVGMGDASVKYIANTRDLKTLKALFTRKGGEVIP